MAASILADGCGHGARCGIMARSVKCAVSRRRLPGTFLESNLDVRHAGGLSHQPDPRALAVAIWVKPDGWSGGGLPLGFVRPRNGTRTNAGSVGVSNRVLLISGAYYFRRMEKTFADLI